MNAKERLIAYCQLRLHGYSIEETKKIMADIDKEMKALALEGEE